MGLYPRNDLNVYDLASINLKIILSTNSSTRIKVRMIWTLIWAIMSSLLYQLSYNLYVEKGLEPLYSGREPNMLPITSNHILNNHIHYTYINTCYIIAPCKNCTYINRLQNGCITIMLTELCFKIKSFILKL